MTFIGEDIAIKEDDGSNSEVNELNVLDATKLRSIKINFQS